VFNHGKTLAGALSCEHTCLGLGAYLDSTGWAVPLVIRVQLSRHHMRDHTLLMEPSVALAITQDDVVVL
jgi:hypothetical protein